MQTRRSFLKGVAVTAAGIAAPMIVPSKVLGAEAPSNRITVGMIGVGRQARYANLPQLLAVPDAQVVAVCDVDSWRVEQAKVLVEEAYAKHAGTPYSGCATFGDFRELLARDDIDAVMISTPDHWHVPAGIAAAKAGKHFSCEKPLSTCVAHGRMLCEAAKKAGVVTRTDSEFRSLRVMQQAVECVRNGRIGKLQRIHSNSPEDTKPVGNPEAMPVPAELNYDLWLGPAKDAPYTEQRVHAPHVLKERPGWLRISDYTNGMIANWGSHLNDIVQWAHNSDRTGPVSVQGTGQFSEGLWDTIVDFDATYEYADGVVLNYTMGGDPSIRFEGSDGWVSVKYPETIEASAPEILNEPLGAGELNLKDTLSDKADFIHAIKIGGETLEPLEVGHRTVSLCQIGLIAIQCGRRLRWDPDKERFPDDEEANAKLDREMRGDWAKWT
ncbi:MAG: Gfo/Idh/MocA family oxidoreductase [Candidatus Hydrogenedentes bacterium]|nr:Gfo/Idh/MocA family oxidoreductase [Candidatus Hydrogenedentota bacterium]